MFNYTDTIGINADSGDSNKDAAEQEVRLRTKRFDEFIIFSCCGEIKKFVRRSVQKKSRVFCENLTKNCGILKQNACKCA